MTLTTSDKEKIEQSVEYAIRDSIRDSVYPYLVGVIRRGVPYNVADIIQTTHNCIFDKLDEYDFEHST